MYRIVNNYLVTRVNEITSEREKVSHVSCRTFPEGSCCFRIYRNGSSVSLFLLACSMHLYLYSCYS